MVHMIKGCQYSAHIVGVSIAETDSISIVTSFDASVTALDLQISRGSGFGFGFGSYSPTQHR